jgi:hypothetical protein
MILFSQRDGRWAAKELGWGPPGATIGLYGCLETDFAAIANDSGHAGDPASIDDALIARQIFIRDPDGSGDYDLLPDNALDLLFSGAYETRHVSGFDAAGIGPAVNSPDTYVILWIATAAVPTHFVIVWSADGTLIADPWTGKVATLAGYGGPGSVHKTTYVKHLPTPGPVPGPSPTPLPLPTPVPVPHFYVEDDKDVVLLPPQSSLDVAKVKADELARANPGRTYDVEDDTEKVVYQAFIDPGPPPLPVPPVPPPAPVPTPPPAPPPVVVHPDFWAELQTFLVDLLKRYGHLR